MVCPSGGTYEQKRYSLAVGSPKKDPNVKVPNQKLYKLLLDGRRQEELRQKAVEEQRRKEVVKK